jgi:hypothetical protein
MDVTWWTHAGWGRPVPDKIMQIFTLKIAQRYKKVMTYVVCAIGACQESSRRMSALVLIQFFNLCFLLHLCSTIQ